jgi:SAM-dependent methyltransferase
MGVAAHLGIDLAEYDARIKTFIPGYEAMLDEAAGALTGRERRIVDLGVGTGALAARCLARAPGARLVGIDVDPGILDAASRRLGARATLVRGSFLRTNIPRCDAIVASFSLHHIRTRVAKRRLYASLRRSLGPGGRIIVADCYPAQDVVLARQQRDEWRAHLEESYSARKAARYFRAWEHEDVYVPLTSELALFAAAGLEAEVVWRAGAFAVLAARR